MLKTLTVSGARVNNVTMSPDGTKLAVGMGWDGVAIFSKGTNDWSDPPQQLADIHSEKQQVQSTAFSFDGRFLCAGYEPSGQFAIWDVEAGTAACIRTIETGDWHACAFSPAGDLLATGGNAGKPVRVHDLLPRGPLDTFSLDLPSRSKQQTLSFACVQCHFASFWNYVDLAGILALYGAAVGHLIDNAALVQELGALGVLLNGFSYIRNG